MAWLMAVLMTSPSMDASRWRKQAPCFSLRFLGCELLGGDDTGGLWEGGVFLTVDHGGEICVRARTKDGIDDGCWRISDASATGTTTECFTCS